MSTHTVMDLRWGQESVEPYIVPVPRIPCVGERIVGPDDIGTFVVTEVSYVYGGGFYHPPDRVVVVVAQEEGA